MIKVDLCKVATYSVVIFAIYAMIYPEILECRAPNSYVYSIDMSSYSNQYVKEFLIEFNKLGNNKAVNFSPPTNPKYVLIPRKIYITEKELEKNTLGLARNSFFKCEIELTSGMDYAKLNLVLLHEFLHCMGYSHTEDPNDLMNAYFNENITKENLKKYALELSELWEE